MRADDIRRLTVEVNERALAQCDKLEEVDGVSGHEVANYRAAIGEVLRFWQGASPAFCFAWFAVVSREADD